MRLFFLTIPLLCFGLIVKAQISGAYSLPVRLSTLEARSNGNDTRLDTASTGNGEIAIANFKEIVVKRFTVKFKKGATGLP